MEKNGLFNGAVIDMMYLVKMATKKMLKMQRAINLLINI